MLPGKVNVYYNPKTAGIRASNRDTELFVRFSLSWHRYDSRRYLLLHAELSAI